MIKPEDFVHSLVSHNKQYQRKTLLPSLLYEPLKWRISSQFTDSEVRATFWGTQDFVSRRESLKKTFPAFLSTSTSTLGSGGQITMICMKLPTQASGSFLCVCSLEQKAARSLKL